MVSLAVYFILLGLGVSMVIKYKNYKSKEFRKWSDERINEVKALLDERLEKVNKLYQEVRMENESLKEEHKEFLNNSNYMEKEYK